MSFSEHVQSEYNARAKRAQGDEKIFRDRAWAEYGRLGLPDRKTESWKYTPLSALTKKAWPMAEAASVPPREALDLREKYQNDFDVLIVVDGAADLNSSVLSSELKPHVKAPNFKAVRLFEDGFASLAAALSLPGLRLEIPAGLRVQRPLLIIRASSSGGKWISVYNEISVGDGGCLNVAELFVGTNEASLRTDLTQAELGEAATVNWLRLQDEGVTSSHFADVQAKLGEAAKLKLIQIHTGAAWARVSLRADLEETESEAQVHGISFGRNAQHIDQRISVNHLAPLTRSQQLFKNVLKDKSRGVLNGKIYIAQDAQKVLSSQMNHSLILSPGAEADTKPELEIYADDVKANHGASVGRLDKDKIFYLVSRGIPPHEAQQMLAHAFVADVLMKIGVPELRALAEERVRGLLSDFTPAMEVAT